MRRGRLAFVVNFIRGRVSYAIHSPSGDQEALKTRVYVLSISRRIKLYIMRGSRTLYVDTHYFSGISCRSYYTVDNDWCVRII